MPPCTLASAASKAINFFGLSKKLYHKLLIKDYGKSHNLALPNIEYVLWAILFGLVIANTVGVARIFRPGVATYEFWLKVGIVLLGARFLLGDVLKLGGVSLALAAWLVSGRVFFTLRVAHNTHFLVDKVLVKG